MRFKIKNILGILILLFLVFPLYSQSIEKGVLIFDDPNYLEKNIFSLDGEWEYYPNSKFNINEEVEKVEYQKIPHNFNKKFNQIIGKERNNTSTYRVIIKGLKPNGNYGIFSRRSPSTASEVYCNNVLIEKYGNCSSIEKMHVPVEIPMYVFLQANSSGEIDLRINVSSFSNHATGLTVALLFSEEPIITMHFRWMITIKAFLIGILLFCCILNFAIYISDKGNSESFLYGFLFLSLLLNVLVKNGSIIGWIINDFSYNVTIWMQNIILWYSPLMYSLIIQKDEIFSKRHPLIDKFFIIMYIAFGLIFSTFPIRYTNYILFVIILADFIFSIYIIFRLAYAFVNKHINLIINLIFYIIFTTGFFLDVAFSDYSTKQVFLFAEVFIIILVISNVINMAHTHQYSFQQINKTLNNLKKNLESHKRFFSYDFIKTFNRKPESIHIGDTAKLDATMLFIRFEVIAPDGRIFVAREEYETIKKIMNIVMECLQKCDGLVSNIYGDGIIAIFNKLPFGALDASSNILNQVREFNNKASRMNELCVMCSSGIHTDKFSAMAIGEQVRIETTFFGEGFSIVRKIVDLSSSLGIPILVSETTVDKINTQKVSIGNLVEKRITKKDGSQLALYEYGFN